MDIRHLIGALIALTFSTWASFSFFRGSITGAPPLYSRGWFQRGLHFAAGIIFGAVLGLLMLTLLLAYFSMHRQLELTAVEVLPSRGSAQERASA